MEKYYADLFNGKRLGTLGKEDINHELLSIECKERATRKGLKMLYDWFEQAEKYSAGKIPVLATHILNDAYKNDLIVLRLEDFIYLTKGVLNVSK